MRIDLNQDLSESLLNRQVEEFLNPADPVLLESMTLEEAIRAVKLRPLRNPIRYYYVVDADGMLQGLVVTKHLLFGDPTDTLRDILDRNIARLRASDTLREALEILAYYHLYSLPVVDEDDQLIGVLEVTPHAVDDQPLSLKEQHLLDRDLFQFLGFSVEQHKWNSPWKGYQVRMPWLLCNLFAGLVCAGIAHAFQQSLIRFVILALFIPLVLTLCESAATQSMTLVLQLMHQRTSKRHLRARLQTEMRTVAMLGFTSGIGVCLASLLWQPSWATMGVIGTSVFLSMVASAAFGTSFPVLLKRFRMDPKVASGPLILMVTDICATTIYLGLGTWWLVPSS